MQIKRRYIKAAAFDADAFRQRHQAARNRRDAKQAAEAKAEEIINKIRESDKPLQTAFELLVPDEGKADTEAGEIVRAANRLLYRAYNDGDVFYDGYGIETCADAVAYLCDRIPEVVEKFNAIADRQLEGEEYTTMLENIIDDYVISYIERNVDLVTTPNKSDYTQYDGKQFVEDNDWQPRFDFESSLPDNVLDLLRKGVITRKDIQSEIQYWTFEEKPEVNIDRYNVYISGLTKNDYEELDNNFYAMLEEWASEFEEEDGGYEEEYEEDREGEEDYIDEGGWR